VRDPAGPIYALHRNANEIDIHMSRIEGTTWVPMPKVTITTPGTPSINFARFASSGSLWIGLRYREGEEMHAWGMAVVEPASGKITYHRADTGLPVPIGVVGADMRGETAYFATNEGVARLSRGEVKVFAETASDLPRALAIAANGNVIVATASGAARWDGKTWDHPAALQFGINDVVATRNGQVWMATERGIAAWDGTKLRRVDTRRGLAENNILDIAIDQYDRLWARGPGSLTLISQ
jgi:ligand-binding sensor domain-containing protein